MVAEKLWVCVSKLNSIPYDHAIQSFQGSREGKRKKDIEKFTEILNISYEIFLEVWKRISMQDIFSTYYM